jgi:hypothetical protein
MAARLGLHLANTDLLKVSRSVGTHWCSIYFISLCGSSVSQESDLDEHDFLGHFRSKNEAMMTTRAKQTTDSLNPTIIKLAFRIAVGVRWKNRL